MLDRFVESVTHTIGLLILRVSIGLMMAIGHGWPKATNFEATTGKMPSFFGLDSAFSAGGAVFGELVCGVLLALGLFGRFSAVVLAFTMAVAAFYVHASDPLFMGAGKAKEPALLYFIPAVVLAITGPGKASLDSLWWKKRSKK